MAEVACEDGQLRRAIGTRKEEQQEGLAYPVEALWVRRLRQDRGCQQLVPVLGDDGEWHHQDAQGQVRDHFGQSLAQERLQGESLYHFAVQVITHRACAGLPVKDREGVDRLRAGLREEAPAGACGRWPPRRRRPP